MSYRQFQRTTTQDHLGVGGWVIAHSSKVLRVALDNAKHKHFDLARSLVPIFTQRIFQKNLDSI